jgi:hypothetical protein
LRPLIWWVIWVALLAGFLQVSSMLGRVSGPPPAPAVERAAVLVGAGLLLLSAAVRWLLLPRVPRVRAAFMLFLCGQAFAEAGGYVGFFLGGPHRGALATCAVLGLLQFMPLFARRYYRPPAAAARREPGGPS